MADNQTFKRWLKVRMGWRHMTLRFPIEQLDAARSYHVEMGAPSDDIEIEWAARGIAGRCRAVDEHNPAHLRFPASDVSIQAGAEQKPSAKFFLRPARRGFAPLALFTCGLSVVLLLLGLMRLEDLVEQVESSATLLLFVPGLLSLYVVRPGEHGLASELLGGIRLMVVVSALCVLSAGVLVILDIDPVLRQRLWLSLLLAASLAMLVVAWSVIRPGWRDRPMIDRSTAPPPESRSPVAILESDASPADDERMAMADDLTADDEAPDDAPQPGWSPTLSKRCRDAARLFGPTEPKGRWARATGLCILILPALLSPVFATGTASLGIEGRLKSEITEIARSDGSHALSLDFFAHIPWTRLYVFLPGATAEYVACTVGEDAFASEVSDRELSIAPRVLTGTSLLVLVDHGEIKRMMAFDDEHGRWTDHAHPALSCYLLAPSDVVTIRSTNQQISISPGSVDPRRVRNRSFGSVAPKFRACSPAA